MPLPTVSDDCDHNNDKFCDTDEACYTGTCDELNCDTFCTGSNAVSVTPIQDHECDCECPSGYVGSGSTFGSGLECGKLLILLTLSVLAGR